MDIFFTLSGFLIARMWLKEVQKSGSFWHTRFLARRFLRIWPMLAAALGLQVGVLDKRGRSGPESGASGSECVMWRELQRRGRGGPLVGMAEQSLPGPAAWRLCRWRWM